MSFVRIWFVNKLVISLYALKKCTKMQFNPIILSKIIVFTDDRQLSNNHFFFTQGISKDLTIHSPTKERERVEDWDKQILFDLP